MIDQLKKMNILKSNENKMYLHEKKVDIPKLTPDRWKRLFEEVDMLPGLIVQVMLAPKEEFYSVVVSVCQLALDEVIEIVALLSDIEPEYIRENVALYEIIEFITKTIQRNKLGEIGKNLKSLLPKKIEK
ncbi:hypothetical protein ACFYKT_16695 [Cytobacillus sp. FJAT-53684]|uniref:Uncharacterized protein n=1 Tax=Cytobacillus mangrovibacter TaxID=3299024 RepID=A0ABW6K5I0_9BACI